MVKKFEGAEDINASSLTPASPTNSAETTEDMTTPATSATDTTSSTEKEEPVEALPVQPLNISAAGQTPPHHRLWYWMKTHRFVAVTIVAMLVIALLAAIPFTRYAIAGTVIHKDFTVVVTDAQTNKPVTSATVRVAGKNAVTDSHGQAKIHTNVGTVQLSVSKKYYKDASVSTLVPFSQKQPHGITLVATGRQVPVTVIDKIGGKPLENAKVSAASSEVLTDKNGEATIVLPANLQEAKGSVTANGYNNSTVTIKVTAAKDSANVFTLTPAGKVYFLSNASGKVDVIKSDLDGQNRQIVLPGTGKEDKTATVMFASTDWKYLALLSKRDSDQAKLYLIETDTDKVTAMDEGDAGFTLVGWNEHQFVYRVDRNTVQYWQPKHTALKSFDAETKKLATLDETASEGSDPYSGAYEYMGNAFILDGEIAYSKNWVTGGAGNLQGKANTLYAVKQTASSRRVIKDFTLNNLPVSITVRPYGPNGLYIQTYDSSNKNIYYEYEDNKISDNKDMTDTDFYSVYPTYLVSPDAHHTFWTDSRDGKNALLIGDETAKNSKQIGLLKDYRAYGWYTDKYLLISKDNSELYVLPAAGLAGDTQPSKVSDYYRPDISSNGYGRGYGGQ